MAKEAAIYLYLKFFSAISLFFRLFPIQRKVVFVASFADNNRLIFEEMGRQELSCRTIFLVKKKIFNQFSKLDEATTLVFEIKHLFQFITSIYHLNTAKVVFIDNYYGFLSAIQFRKEAECIQLWHANGAIKKFGLEDQSVSQRSPQAQARFNRVYKQFQKIAIGSDAMAYVFQQAFGAEKDQFIKTGIPRTDIFYSVTEKDEAERRLYKDYPFLKGKKVILYAPTYRDEELATFELRINLELMQEELGNEYVLMLRLHPAIKNSVKITESVNEFAYDFSSYPVLSDLLFLTDILITDYSSIPFEYSILNKPMIFFPYDLTHYEQTRGIWFDYKGFVPGPTVFSTKEIALAIKKGEFDLGAIEHFNARWNHYSTGNSSKNMVLYIKEILETHNKTKLKAAQ
jgi:teichoic acid glycerol-phosphate primase